MSICIKSKLDSVVMELEGKGSLVCFARGQIKHLFVLQALFQKHEELNNGVTLADGWPRCWCQKDGFEALV